VTPDGLREHVVARLSGATPAERAAVERRIRVSVDRRLLRQSPLTEAAMPSPASPTAVDTPDSWPRRSEPPATSVEPAGVPTAAVAMGALLGALAAWVLS
jgi:hypothetical protein